MLIYMSAVDRLKNNEFVDSGAPVVALALVIIFLQLAIVFYCRYKSIQSDKVKFDNGNIDDIDQVMEVLYLFQNEVILG